MVGCTLTCCCYAHFITLTIQKPFELDDEQRQVLSKVKEGTGMCHLICDVGHTVVYVSFYTLLCLPIFYYKSCNLS